MADRLGNQVWRESNLMQLKMINNFHPLAGDWAYASIQSNFQAAIQRCPAVLADRDPEDLHQMRVSLRRLRTAVEVFSPVIQLPPELRDRPIATIAKTLGQVRDLDVLQAWFRDYEKQNQPPQSELKTLARLHQHLVKRRRKAMGAVEQLLHSPRYETFVAALEGWLQSPSYRAASQLPVAMLLPDLMLPLISQALLHPGWLVATEIVEGKALPQADLSPQALAKLLRHQGAELHDLRKQSKRLRYQAELLQDCLGEAYGDRLRQFKAIQAVLGAFQDEVVLTQVLQQELGQHWTDKLPNLKQCFQDQHQAQWHQWQILQHQYLDPAFRRELRQQIADQF